MSTLKFQVIIPCYNEASRLPVQEFKEFLSSDSNDTDILFVNDGSKDKTSDVLAALKADFPQRVNTLELNKNSGKAEAVRSGVLKLLEEEAEFDYIAFMDADLSTPLSEITEIRKAILEFSNPSMVFGSRIKLFGSTEITRSNARHYVGRIIATMISKSLKLAIYDTQCGFKFIRKDRLKSIFEERFTSRWLFDVEIIFRLLILFGYEKIEKEMFEYPVKKWTEKGDSKIPLTYAFRIPLELMRIRSKYSSKTID